MAESIRNQWMMLCEQACQERDAAKLLALVRKINQLMEEEDREKKALLAAHLARESSQNHPPQK